MINDKEYIGKRSCKCKIENDKYLGSGKVFKKALKKYGKQKFFKTIIKVFDSSEEANSFEKRLIESNDACNSNKFYNIAGGGLGGNLIKGHSLEEKKKIWKKISRGNAGKPKIGGVFDRRGSKNPRYNSEERLCDNCGKKLYVMQSVLSRNKRHYCSKECKNKKINHFGGNNPNAKERVFFVDGVEYKKPTREEAVLFLKSEFDLTANYHWFGTKGVPKMYQHRVKVIK